MKALATLCLLLLAGCSNVPVAIKTAPQPDWQLNQISGKAASHQNEVVRWGGQIVKVENNDSGSLLHIAQFPVNSYGRPDETADSQGRFLARTADFIDPYIYKSGTLVTVAGKIADEQSVTVDKKNMTIPVVEIGQIYRWTPRQYVHDPFWYDSPFYYDRFGYGFSHPRWRTRGYYSYGPYW
jgi:outer membrane lipoprotein